MQDAKKRLSAVTLVVKRYLRQPCKRVNTRFQRRHRHLTHFVYPYSIGIPFIIFFSTSSFCYVYRINMSSFISVKLSRLQKLLKLKLGSYSFAAVSERDEKKKKKKKAVQTVLKNVYRCRIEGVRRILKRYFNMIQQSIRHCRRNPRVTNEYFPIFVPNQFICTPTHQPYQLIQKL